ncbi:E3 ubiquitin-protein ligase TRIM39-like [Rhinatrema bivittatum]|uniref:E3 ubiquitin-protein ligase TRIM39-like n=1 Tax=Rhinatrema bivittatum TaxID=194408 RepID=UPI001126BE13|nr:E3 ubiquitin-protein ligase TRIM39-like [Rhinatrema bivittatum]
MAAPNPVKNLQEEATCSLCLDYFSDPVSIECGHNFCRPCISKCWEGLQADFPCPQCRERSGERSFRPNRQLASVTEIAKQLFQTAPREPARSLCEDHKETLKLFCEEDERPICVVCSLSRDHKAHDVIPIEEAVQEYKVKLKECLHQLKRKLGDIERWRSDEKGNAGVVKKQAEVQRQMILTEFEKLRQLLEEEQQVFLTQVEEEEREILQKLNENIGKLSEQRSSLKEVIAEIEEKGQQPATDFLQGVKSLLLRSGYMNFPLPNTVDISLRKNASNFLCHNIILNKLSKKWKVSVTLDPETANPFLILSEDRKSVTWGRTGQQLLKNPKRFDASPCVLGCEGFTSGRHYWEVQVEIGRDWSVGAARGSVSRKEKKPESSAKMLGFPIYPKHGDCQVPRRDKVFLNFKEAVNVPQYAESKIHSARFEDDFDFNLQAPPCFFRDSVPRRRVPQKGDAIESPEKGIWVLEAWKGQYRALTSLVTTLTPHESPRKLGVYLDYEEGRLSFYNADTVEHLYTFSACFNEKIFPYFCIWSGTEIRLY